MINRYCGRYHDAYDSGHVLSIYLVIQRVRVVATIMLRILGPALLHRVFGGKLLLVEQVLVGVKVVWGLMQDIIMDRLDDVHQGRDNTFHHGSILCDFFWSGFLPCIWWFWFHLGALGSLVCCTKGVT